MKTSMILTLLLATYSIGVLADHDRWTSRGEVISYAKELVERTNSLVTTLRLIKTDIHFGNDNEKLAFLVQKFQDAVSANASFASSDEKFHEIVELFGHVDQFFEDNLKDGEQWKDDRSWRRVAYTFHQLNFAMYQSHVNDPDAAFGGVLRKPGEGAIDGGRRANRGKSDGDGDGDDGDGDGDGDGDHDDHEHKD